MSGSNYEFCGGCDSKALYMGEEEAPDGVEVWHEKCLAERIASAVAGERSRIYAELGNDHFVIFTEDRWTIEHSVECRLGGHMHECADHEAVAKIVHGFGPEMLGRWRIDGVNSDGVPVLVRQPEGSPS